MGSNCFLVSCLIDEVVVLFRVCFLFSLVYGCAWLIHVVQAVHVILCLFLVVERLLLIVLRYSCFRFFRVALKLCMLSKLFHVVFVGFMSFRPFSNVVACF